MTELTPQKQFDNIVNTYLENLNSSTDKHQNSKFVLEQKDIEKYQKIILMMLFKDLNRMV